VSILGSTTTMQVIGSKIVYRIEQLSKYLLMDLDSFEKYFA